MNLPFPLLIVVALATLSEGWAGEPAQLYQTVNVRPQLVLKKNQFLVYWALWRSLTEPERAALSNAGGELISNRSIRWKSISCDSGQTLRTDEESFDYRDEITLDSEGRVIPIREAPRPDWRYLVMANLSSLHLSGPGKTATGSHGEILIEATHRLFPRTPETLRELESAGFVDLHAAPWNASYAPTSWPVFYDERAHKPHRLHAEGLLSSVPPLSTHFFGMRLVWNGCGAEVRIKAFIPIGGMPEAGPTRPGRTEKGSHELEIVESTEWNRSEPEHAWR